MLDFQLFRAKVFRIPGSLFSTADSKPALLAEAIASLPESGSRNGVTWHIGNVEFLDTADVYFAFGRTTRANLPMFDPKSRRFVEQEFESAPFTHVLADVELGVCAIARKSQLAPRTETFASHLAKTLNASTTAYRKDVRFAVEPMKDPERFIEQIAEAVAVKSFSMTFSRPNPFDANEDFQRPMETFLEEARGDTGKTSIAGDDLDRGVLTELTRSAAATGNDASARIVRPDRARTVRVRLRENIAQVATDDIRAPSDARGILAIVRRMYLRIRRDDAE